jgi:predicted nucleic acid-binding Zn ribbon protein
MMIDINKSTCKVCGKSIDQVPGRRMREFCSDTCRQRYHRAKTKPVEEQADNTALVTELRVKVQDQAQYIEELEQENTRLKHKLNVEQLYREDLGSNKKHTFLAWLKRQPTSPLAEKILAAGLQYQLSQNDTYKYYDYRLRVLLRCSPDEMEQFVELWKLMLLS